MNQPTELAGGIIGGMKLIGWKERRRRMRASLDEAWEQAGHVPEEPGLREKYPGLPRAPIRLLCCPLVKDVNHGGLLRLADAFRLERVDFSPETDEAVDFSGNRGTTAYQPYRWIPVEKAIAEARADGFVVAALSLSKRSHPLRQAPWRFPVALVLGAENEGVPEEIEELCDFSLGIPLYGLVQSLNVATAAAIVVHSAVAAYTEVDPAFIPARKASRQLITTTSMPPSP